LDSLANFAPITQTGCVAISFQDRDIDQSRGPS
jgi:hypothetical protein